VVVSVMTWALALGGAPPPVIDPGDPTAPTLQTRRDAERGDRPSRRYGPQPPPELNGHHEADEVTVTIRADGTAKAHVPRSFRAAGGICLVGLCLSTRGVRRQPGAKRGPVLSTAPVPFAIVFAFGYLPASKNAAVALLADSSDARVQQTIAWQGQALDDARRGMRRRLADIVGDPTLSPRSKRRIVFELWDDAATSAGAPTTEDTMARQRARAAADIADVVERFVAQRMPQGSELGYGPRELASRNASRHAAERFAPYRDRANGHDAGHDPGHDAAAHRQARR
jgi:hypothetical protein